MDQKDKEKIHRLEHDGWHEWGDDTFCKHCHISRESYTVSFNNQERVLCPYRQNNYWYPSRAMWLEYPVDGRGTVSNYPFVNFEDRYNDLIRTILPYRWQHECMIITDFLPKYPREDTKPLRVVVARSTGKGHNEDGGDFSCLRYSKGPRQGFFWDGYPDDLHSFELAVLALSQCPTPGAWRVDP